jgi:phthiocerol/phenolphthiocerol synthesis type-I polyketide synthase E
MQATGPGAMLSVQLPAAQVEPRLGGSLDLAAVNGPAASVVSGPPEGVEELERRLAVEGIAVRRLHVQRAFHSRLMDSVVEPFAAEVRRARLAPPRIPFVSNLTGTWIRDAEATEPGYWAAHLRAPVRFGDGVAELLSDPRRALLEVGPGGTLAALARQQAPSGTVVVASLPRPGEPRSELESALTALARLWIAGTPADWAGLNARGRRRRVPLPTYPFERRRCWVETGGTEAAEPDRGAPAVTLHPRPALATEYVPPESPVERRLAELWQEILGLDRVGAHDSFFDLGGHSLLATQLVSRLHEAFAVDLPLHRLFEAPTIARLAEVVEETLIDGLEALSEEEASRMLAGGEAA